MRGSSRFSWGDLIWGDDYLRGEIDADGLVGGELIERGRTGLEGQVGPANAIAGDAHVVRLVDVNRRAAGFLNEVVLDTQPFVPVRRQGRGRCLAAMKYRDGSGSVCRGALQRRVETHPPDGIPANRHVGHPTRLA